MEPKKAYGIVTALGTKLGERAREEPELDRALRSAPDLAAFGALLREKTAGLLPPALVDQFLGDVVKPDDWVQWRARLLLQLKLVRDGGAPAPGHEAGRGVGRH